MICSSTPRSTKMSDVEMSPKHVFITYRDADSTTILENDMTAYLISSNVRGGINRSYNGDII